MDIAQVDHPGTANVGGPPPEVGEAPGVGALPARHAVQLGAGTGVTHPGDTAGLEAWRERGCSVQWCALHTAHSEVFSVLYNV